MDNMFMDPNILMSGRMDGKDGRMKNSIVLLDLH